VIFDDLHVEGVTVAPVEGDAALEVDPDAVLSGAVALQRGSSRLPG
jgi:hypothetical protein